MRNTENKHLHVSCAIIEQGGLVLAAQRSAVMSMPLKWEFPGGKIRNGESPENGLRREISEELGVDITVMSPLPLSTHAYPSLTVTLYPFICAIQKGRITLHEHASVTWLRPEDLYSLDWAEADLPVVGSYLKVLAR